ncbi:MAG TPA: adenosine deaminase [Candidatus Acidoferrum sp.]|nr:adenosine deaminase [Candidatus Acidoferrum sp.]
MKLPVSPEDSTLLWELPKAELHVHLEGTINPYVAVDLAKRNGVTVDYERMAARYNFRTFEEFLSLFKDVTAFLKNPEDYALVANIFGTHLDKTLYAEITLSAGVMLLRKQNVDRNFQALQTALEKTTLSRTRVQWIFDAVRQFGPEAAMEVAKLAVKLKSSGVVAFGLGGNELSVPLVEFRRVYDYVAENGLHRVVHAGEIGGPDQIRDAINLLGAERIGHGIAAIRDPELMSLLAEKGIPLEICPSSNVRTGALAEQLGKKQARVSDHPLPTFVRRGIPVTLATDDPAMFHTSLYAEFLIARGIGMEMKEVVRLARAGFECAFLSQPEKQILLDHFDAKTKDLGLL